MPLASGRHNQFQKTLWVSFIVSVYGLKILFFHLGSFHNNLTDYNISLCLMNVKKQNSKDCSFLDSLFKNLFPLSFLQNIFEAHHVQGLSSYSNFSRFFSFTFLCTYFLGIDQVFSTQGYISGCISFLRRHCKFFSTFIFCWYLVYVWQLTRNLKFSRVFTV